MRRKVQVPASFFMCYFIVVKKEWYSNVKYRSGTSIRYSNATMYHNTQFIFYYPWFRKLRWNGTPSKKIELIWEYICDRCSPLLQLPDKTCPERKTVVLSVHASVRAHFKTVLWAFSLPRKVTLKSLHLRRDSRQGYLGPQRFCGL